MEEVKRDGFIIYRSFYEALSNLDDEQMLKCMRAICEYGLNGISPEDAGIVQTIFMLVKPQIDANNRRYLGGCKGGRPRKADKEQSAAAEPKKRGRKPKNRQPEEITAQEVSEEVAQVSDQPEEKPKEKPKKDSYGEFGNVLLSKEDYESLIAKKGEEDTKAAIEILDNYIESLSPSEKKKYKGRNHRQCMYIWVFNRVEEDKFKAQKKEQQENRNESRNNPAITIFPNPRALNGFNCMQNKEPEDWNELESQILDN